IESKGFEGPGPTVSPAMPVMSSQELIEEILLDAARATGLIELRHSTEAVELIRGGEDAADDVALRVRSLISGAEEVLTARALVGADGSSSTIREALGLRLEGVKDLLHLCNCYFRADIEAHLGDRRGVLFFVNNEQATGVLQPLDGAGRWLCQINVSPEDWSAEMFTKERAREWIRGAAGIDDLDVDVLSIGFWKLNSTVVERFVTGRVVLCGDAAHQFPPTGGLGVNTGLQGMHNVMWKLAWYVLGRAGWDLVHTYDTERRQPAQDVTSQSLQNSANVGRINAAAAAGGDSGLNTEPRAATATTSAPSSGRGTHRPLSCPTVPSRQRSRTRTPTTRHPRRPGAVPLTSGSAAPMPTSRPCICSVPTSPCSLARTGRAGRRLRPRSPWTTAHPSTPTDSEPPAWATPERRSRSTVSRLTARSWSAR
ncbi:MAG TPA: FAD-dependent monooxygenase, partial [Ilumatobacteraceae bacterium]|nr:FAD-dependent monooxygenase [Ilumatobacteraceae bacterium]